MSDGGLRVLPLEEAEYPLASEIVARSVRAFWAAEQNLPDDIRKRSTKQEDFLAWRDGVAVGYAAVKQNEIGHLFVHPDAAGQGVGSALVAFSEQLLRDRGNETVKVYASLTAVAFYEKRGFHRVHDKAFELAPNVVLDSVLMEKPL